MTALFTKADASKGRGLYRSAIVAQLAEIARRIQDGVLLAEGPGVRGDRRSRHFGRVGQSRLRPVRHRPAVLVFVRHLRGLRGRAAGPRGGIVTRMSHQMVYLGHPQQAVGLLDIAGKKTTMPASRMLVAFPGRASARGPW
ncbi:hypothetical protein AT728_35650 [Streptomyces silvensis]|uniref:Uncharacterized protein n=1 Tax=Streptomyces silvensis TaxID=1765722 RepID=A0A0W7WW45_9ACTN|nr:hypothetical protein AT728_35650 [Streptomyces silvensis]